MASLPPSLLFLTLSLILLLIFVTPAFSISRRALDHHHRSTTRHHDHLMKNGFRITLKHVDAGGNFTKFERLERAMKRGRHRLQKFSQMVLAAATDDSDSDMKSTVFPGNGEFLMKLSIGTPPESFSAILDTGSDLLWTQCKPCQQCYDQPTPVFDPNKSSSFSKMPCSTGLCKALPTSSCGGDGCEYLYSYGDYSSTQGILATETFTFDKVSVHNIGFGCGEDNEGSGFSQGAGLVGLGRGPLSLVTQLGKPKFSYCLTSVDDNKPSTLLIGSHASLNAASTTKGDIKTTPLVKNPSQPSFYYLSLEGITVGTTKLPIKKSTFALNADGSGGLIIDSGTTITYLEESAFGLVKKAFTSQVKLPVDTSSSTGLDLCFTLPSGSSSVEVPALVFHFAGGADLDLPGENYMIGDSSLGLMCLAMGGSNGMSIFGNVQQQNMLVVHDLDKETLSFLPTECDKL